MRTPLRTKGLRASVASTKAAPAPVRGWNARDAINMMKPEYAYRLVNWWPMASYLAVRDGSIDHLTGMTGEVESLLVYRPENGSEKLFACADNAIYNATSAGAVGAAAVSSLANNRWNYCNFSTSGGNFLVCVNGANDLQLYDGSTWKALNAGSTPAFTGVATNTLIGVLPFKERLFFIKKNSLSLWYLPVKSIAGAALELPLQSVFRKGGHIVAITNWTRDGGAGVDDFLLVITDQGEVACYKGTNPSDANNWGLVGMYSIAPPLGPSIGYGGDVLIASKEGLVPASAALVSDQTKPGIALSDPILSAWSDAAQLYGGNYGWDVIHYPHASMLLVNVPVASGQQLQFAMNTQTGAWSQFTGMPANCWAIFGGNLYFGGKTFVRRAWTGQNDAGSSIQADAVSAFDPFGDPVAIKRWSMCRPTISILGDVEDFRIGLATDFRLVVPDGVVEVSSGTGAVWDTSNWDDAVWTGTPEARNGWYALGGIGYYGALALRVRTKSAKVQWSATAYLMERGSVL